MGYRYGNSIRSFAEISSYDFKEQRLQELAREIQGNSKEYILGVDEEEYQNYLFEKYLLEPLNVSFDRERILEPTVSKEWVEDRHYREKYQTDVYTFTIEYPYQGSVILFRVRPDSWQMTSAEIVVSERDYTVSYSFKLYKKDPEEFKRTKEGLQQRAFVNLGNTNIVAGSWNAELRSNISSLFRREKDKYKSENDFFTAINVKVNPDTASVFTAPTVKKKIIPQPKVSSQKEFSSEPMMSGEMYADVLKVIYDSGKNMEKKPALYQGKNEEGLRDQFLFVLETRYDATTATGETFNRGGKTDIILKYANDGSNLFVAECKFWHGGAEFLKAISQLFDRYLTWRDSKAVLIMFVTNKDFTNVLKTMQSEIRKHPYFVKESGLRGETSMSYIFHLPQDNNKQVYFEVLAFHYDK